MFRQMLLAGAMRLHAPENDEGFDFDDPDPGAEGDEAEVDEFEGDEPDVEDDVDLADEDDPEPQPANRQPVSRGANRIATLAREAREAKQRAEALEREMAAIRAERAGVTQAETERQRAERLAAMSEGERLDYLRREGEQRVNQRLDALAFQTADANDRADFRALCASTPVAAKMADEVEALVQAQRARGMNVERSVAFKFLLGEKALARQSRAGSKGARTAQAQRERQQVRPGTGRGDVPQSGARGKNEAAQRRARLENIEL